MKTLTTVFSTILLASLFLTSCQGYAPVKWEYKVLYFDAQKISSDDKNYESGTDFFKRAISSTSIIPEESSLNQLGKDNWEIVSSYVESETVYPNLLAQGSGVSGLQPNVRPQRLVVIFKRPVKKS